MEISGQDKVLYQIRKAGFADIGEVVSVLQDAANWLIDRGMPLWKTNELSSDNIREDIIKDLYYVVLDGRSAVGTFKFQPADRMYWPEMTEGGSVYMHRIAVRRSHAGKGISGIILDWAKNEAKMRGKCYLRLDCEASRIKLCRLYENNGFVKHSERQVGPYYVARYQFRLNRYP
ncbi:GNAT family N-acetyltransferase [bacterium]|nr:GNAT family N-acetyltransferase [bacterium]